MSWVEAMGYMMLVLTYIQSLHTTVVLLTTFNIYKSSGMMVLSTGNIFSVLLQKTVHGTEVACSHHYRFSKFKIDNTVNIRIT